MISIRAPSISPNKIPSLKVDLKFLKKSLQEGTSKFAIRAALSPSAKTTHEIKGQQIKIAPRKNGL